MTRRPRGRRAEGLDGFLAVCLAALCRVRAPAPARVLGSLAWILGGLDARARRRALALARALGRRGLARWRLASAILYDRGRLVAGSHLPALVDVEDVQRRVDVTGLERLERAGTGLGSIVLVFHLGPASVGAALAAGGQPIVVAGDTDYLAWPRPRASWLPLTASRHFVLVEPDRGVDALYRVRRLLLAGRGVLMAADADRGREAFCLRVAGADLTVRSAWWTLRRQTRAQVLPALAHCHGSRVRVEIHPPLPAPLENARADLEACRGALATIVEDYVRRFPAQCLSLALREDRET